MTKESGDAETPLMLAHMGGDARATAPQSSWGGPSPVWETRKDATLRCAMADYRRFRRSASISASRAAIRRPEASIDIRSCKSAFALAPRFLAQAWFS